MRNSIFSFILFALSLTSFAQVDASSNHKTLVRRPHDYAKVRDVYHPDTLYTKNAIFLGKMPVLWTNKGIAKKKMTCAMMGGDIIFFNLNGEWEAYASFTPDVSLMQKHLAAKTKFTLVEKYTIKYGNEGYQVQTPESKTGEFTKVYQEGDKVYLEGKISGNSTKKFRLCNVNDSQFLVTTDDKLFSSYLVQVK